MWLCQKYPYNFVPHVSDIQPQLKTRHASYLMARNETHRSYIKRLQLKMILRFLFTGNVSENTNDSPIHNFGESTNRKDSYPGQITPNKPITPKRFERLLGALYDVTNSVDAATQHTCVSLAFEELLCTKVLFCAFELGFFPY